VIATGRDQVQDFAPDEIDLATTFYDGVSEPNARAVLDFLIDHPDARFDGAAIASALGLAQHRAVARATFAYGEVARAQHRNRPWQEAQLGYLMPGAQAALLRQARASVDASGQSAPVG
jgi:hypothetical protein